METHGSFAPETEEEARERYAALAPMAKTVVREVAKAMEFDRAEYSDRVTGDVVETARDALFASLLVVYRGDRTAFESWCADRDVEVTTVGSEEVDNVVWHHVPFADRVLAATYQQEPEAAAGTLRRQVFGRVYRDLLEE